MNGGSGKPEMPVPAEDTDAAIYETAQVVAPGGLLVEVGAFAGQSTKVFLDGGLQVHAIDPGDKRADRVQWRATGHEKCM